MMQQPAGATRQREAAQRYDKMTRGRHIKRWCNNKLAQRDIERWQDKTTRRGDVTTSWQNKRSRLWRSKRTTRGNASISWHGKTARGRRNERITRGNVTTSWHDETTSGRHDKRQHTLIVVRVQKESTGKVVAMVVAHIEQKSECLCVQDESQVVSDVVQKIARICELNWHTPLSEW